MAVHLNNLQKIANANSGSRAILLGYNASADYILQSLAETDYVITRNYFDMYVWAQIFSQFGTVDKPAAFAGMFVPFATAAVYLRELYRNAAHQCAGLQ